MGASQTDWLTRRRLLEAGAGAAFVGAAIPLAFGQEYKSWGSELDHKEAHDRWEKLGIRSDERGLKRLGLAVRYRTDPERIQPFLVAPLEVDPTAEVQINFFIIMNALGGSNVFTPGPVYGECDMYVSCLYKGHRAMTCLPWILDQDYGRYAGRESVMLRKKDGLIFLDYRDGALHAAVTRQGKTMMKIEAPLSKEPAHPYFWFRETGWGEMRYDYRLNVDWRKGVFDDGPVELWQHFGSDEGYPTGMPPEDTWDRLPRAIDLATIKLDLGDPSPLDPYAGLPVLEILGGSGSLGPALHPSMAVPRGPNKILGKRQRTENNERVNLGPVEKAPLEPLAWIHKGFDPPVFRGKPYKPAGWPAKAGAIALPREVIEAYKAREAIEVGPVSIVDLTLALDPALHARSVPAAFQPGPTPHLRLLALAVETSDVSTTPFTEFWLLSACQAEGAPAWLALAHIVGWGGDVLNGREIWGYPSKLGEPSLEITPDAVAIRGRRVHRDFVRVDAKLDRTRDVSASKTAMTVVGAQIQPKSRQPRHKWVLNPWSLDMTAARTVQPSAVSLSFPNEPGPDLVGLSDPWSEFASAKVITAAVGCGSIRRLPARILGPVLPDSAAFVVDRGDGFRPVPNKPVTSFLVRTSG